MKDTPLRMVAYMSKAIEPLQETAVSNIVATAKRMNPLFGITGVLFYNRGFFLQVIEGQPEYIAQLLENILQDSRHTDVEVIVDEAVAARGFSSWNMDYFNLSEDTPFDRDNLTAIGMEFKENLLPRADTFVVFYKAIIEKSEQ